MRCLRTFSRNSFVKKSKFFLLLLLLLLLALYKNLKLLFASINRIWSMERDEQQKRITGAPLPSWIYIVIAAAPFDPRMVINTQGSIYLTYMVWTRQQSTQRELLGLLVTTTRRCLESNKQDSASSHFRSINEKRALLLPLDFSYWLPPCSFFISLIF